MAWVLQGQLSGAAGAAGPPGSVIHSGTGAPAAQGIDGDYFLDTAAGVIYGPKAGGAWPPTGTDLKGAAGPAGATIVATGAAPLAGDGNDGDFFLDTSTGAGAGDFYGPKAAGVWPPSSFNLVGADGKRGSQWIESAGVPNQAGLAGDMHLDTTTGDVRQLATDGTAWGAPVANIKGADGTGVTIKGTADGTTPVPGVIDPGDTYIVGATLPTWPGVSAIVPVPVPGDGIVSDGAGGWINAGPLKGPQGIKGDDGATWDSGNGAPVAPGSVTGDQYLDTATNDVYQWDGTAWQGPTANIQGEMGPAIAIEGEVDATTAASPAHTAGHAYVIDIAGKSTGDVLAAGDLPGWLATALATDVAAGIVKQGDIIFSDGTAWHDGGQVRGPDGLPGQDGDEFRWFTTANTEAELGTDPDGTGGTVTFAPAGITPEAGDHVMIVGSAVAADNGKVLLFS